MHYRNLVLYAATISFQFLNHPFTLREPVDEQNLMDLVFCFFNVYLLILRERMSSRGAEREGHREFQSWLCTVSMEPDIRA